MLVSPEQRFEIGFLNTPGCLVKLSVGGLGEAFNGVMPVARFTRMLNSCVVQNGRMAKMTAQKSFCCP